MSLARTPLAFVDFHGYVTPYNGRVTDNLPGRYLYTQEEVNYYLEKQIEADSLKEMQRYGGGPGAEEETIPPPPVVVGEPPVPTSNVPPPVVPMVPPVAVAVPAPPPGSEPPQYLNLTQEERDALPRGVDPQVASSHVFRK